MTPEQRLVVIAWMRREIHILQGQEKDYRARGDLEASDRCWKRAEAFAAAINKLEAT